MERWVDQRASSSSFHCGMKLDTSSSSNNNNNTNRRVINHVYRRSSSGSMEQQQQRHHHYQSQQQQQQQQQQQHRSGPESQVGRPYPPTFPRKNDRLHSQPIKRRNEHDIRRYSSGNNNNNNNHVGRIQQQGHGNGCGPHSRINPHRMHRDDERNDKNHHQQHQRRRSSLSVASDPLPSQISSSLHHNHKLGSRWSKPSLTERKLDVSYRKQESIPVEIVSTITTTSSSSSSSSQYDTVNDLSDGSPSAEYSPNVIDNEIMSLSCCYVSTTDTTTTQSKPQDANPQEDSSLSPMIMMIHHTTTQDASSSEANDPCRNTLYLPASLNRKIDTLPEMIIETSPGSMDHTSIPSSIHAKAVTKQDLTSEEIEKLQPPILCDEEHDHIEQEQQQVPTELTHGMVVGSRVAIYWDCEGKYFPGTITKIRPTRKKPYHIKYDDGDREWIHFQKERFYMIDDSKEVSSDTTKQFTGTQHVSTNWVSAGMMMKNDSDSDTDDEEVTQWAIKMLGIPPVNSVREQIVRQASVPKQSSIGNVGNDASFDNYDIPMSISEKVKLGRRNRSNSFIIHPDAVPPKKQIKSTPPKVNTTKSKSVMDAEIEAAAKLRKQQARPLTAAEIRSILSNDDRMEDSVSTSWVRRSVRQPSKSSLNAPRVKELLEKLVCNDSDMIVLKMKKYCSDLDTPSIVIDAVLDALEDNTNCEALYIQNFNEGMRDEQVLHLLRVLQRPSCKIWCLNIGETYKVQMKTWEKFTNGLATTNVTHMYASEHTITSELKDQIRETIRQNRSKHHLHDDPSNLDTIVQCTHCWWNPINAKSLRPYIQRKGYEHILRDAEVQGLQGTMSGALLS